MSFIDFIKKIQNKPPYIRAWILGLFVFVFMIITVSLWITSLKNSSLRFNLSETEKGIYQEKDKIIGNALLKANISKKEAFSLKDALKASIGALFEDAADEELNRQTEEIEELNIQKGGSAEVKPMRLPLSK